ncbi:MAG: alpha/beta fold hydrolase [Chitinophagaceae bacterium]|nr:MAG: alpha/beta fold hydrolase [Chitinophagaceae bacterium]
MSRYLVVLSIMLCCIPLQAKVPGRDSTGYFLSFDKIKIYYEDKGEGFPVVLVHGFINTGDTWKRTELLKTLQEQGFRVITLDMRGNGKSDKPHNSEAYAKDAEAKDIIGLVGYLKISSYDVVGYSRGSIITARLLVHDKRIRKAVIGGMGTDFTNPDWPRRIMFYRALSGDSIAELAGVVKYIKDSKLDQQALAMMQKEQPSTPQSVLAKFKQPILVVVGDADEDKAKAKDLAAIFPNAQYVIVPGDHGGAMRSKEFAAEVISFLKR